MEEFDSLVIGAGVVGLAVARRLAASGRQTVIIDQEQNLGQGISSRNSEVIHAGLYYKPGSLKAETCVAGRRFLYQYAMERGIPHRKTGKLIVATTQEEVNALQQIEQNAAACGVDGLVWLSSSEAASLESAVQCQAALLSPESGIIDSHQLMLSYLADAEAQGAVFVGASRFVRAQTGNGTFSIHIADPHGTETQFACHTIVNAAGLSAPNTAASIEGLDQTLIPSLHLSRGAYFYMSGKPPFQRLIYPAPEEHGLGIHATLDLAGRVRFGPDHEWIETESYDVPAGRAEYFYGAIRRYYPGLPDNALSPAYAGIRPKISLSTDPADRGAILKDFYLQGPETHKIPGLVNLFGIESPGLTAASALAERVFAMLNTAAR